MMKVHSKKKNSTKLILFYSDVSTLVTPQQIQTLLVFIQKGIEKASHPFVEIYSILRKITF